MFKRTVIVFLVEGEKVVSKFAFEDFIFVVGSAASSVSTTLEFAAFRSHPDTTNIAQLVLFGFFCAQPWQKKFGDKVQAKSSHLPCWFRCELGQHTA